MNEIVKNSLIAIPVNFSTDLIGKRFQVLFKK